MTKPERTKPERTKPERRSKLKKLSPGGVGQNTGTLVEWIVWSYGDCLACGKNHYPVIAFRLDQRYANAIARGLGTESKISDMFWKCPKTDQLFILDESYHEGDPYGNPLDEIRMISLREFRSHRHYSYFESALPDLLHRSVRTLLDFDFVTADEVIDIFEESYCTTVTGQQFLPLSSSKKSDGSDTEGSDTEGSDTDGSDTDPDQDQK